MIAMIRTEQGVYVSPVFALRVAGWRTEAFVFDESQEWLIRLKMWSPRKVYIVREEEPFPASRGDWHGYDWLLNSPAARAWYGFRKRIPTSALPEVSPFVKPYSLPEWTEIVTQTDANDLDRLTGGFHDARVLWEKSEGKDLTVRFDTSWNCLVTVRFLGVNEPFKLSSKFQFILHSEWKRTPEGIQWTVDDAFPPGDVGEKPFEPFTLTCQKVFWQASPTTTSWDNLDIRP